MSKHQWKAVVRPNCKSFVLGDLGEVIAGTVEYPPNAHLIAAAPDMLAALEAVVEWQESPHPEEHPEGMVAENLVRAAIAKAKGKME